MNTFRVWAPAAQRVELALGERRIAMQAQAGGWWSVAVPEATGDTDYAFAVDGGKPLPDPRSPSQPKGIHGPSRRVDHDTFAWTDQRWCAGPLSAAVIYELHVGTFTAAGTFEAIIPRLDHLAELGITHVELMPVAEFSGTRGWGYDGVDLFAPHRIYGGPEGLKRLVDACHARGLAVMLDVVYNHLGPTGNYLARFGPYFTDRYATPWGEAVNFDGPGSDEVRRFFCDNALMWLRDYHFDGLRIDAVHAIVDTSATHFLEQLAAEVKALEAELGRHLTVIAESDLNDPRIVRRTEVGGYGLNAQWNEDFHHALHAVLAGETSGYYADFGHLADLARVLERNLVYDGRYSVYRDRRHGRPAGDLPGPRFVACLQNHDQVGNRAKGERMSHLVDPARLKIGAAIVLLSPFVPMLFQGEEWAATSPFLYFTDHQEPDLAESVRNGRREEFAAFGWNPEDIPDPQALQTFERSKLDWHELAAATQADMLGWHRRLIELRRQVSGLSDWRCAPVRTRFAEDKQWLVFSRGPVTVVCNFGEDVRQIPLGPNDYRVLIASDPESELGASQVAIPGESVIILQADNATRESSE